MNQSPGIDGVGSHEVRAEVIAIGDELTSGQRLDTNSRWISSELGLLGIPVAFHTTAGDTLEAGIEAFRTAARRADIVIATGGLGPTADDLTREVLAAVAEVPLEPSSEALVAVESRFARRGMPMPESNRRQALLPRGSRLVPNPLGTAPGIDLEVDLGGSTSRIFALPGVPSEMRVMWRDTVVPALAALRPAEATIVQRCIKCFGAGESAIEAMLPDLVERGRQPAVGITAHEATITLRIAARGGDQRACQAAIAATESIIRDCLGDLVYGVETDEIEDAALRAVATAGWTLASVEIGTEGHVAALLAQAQGRFNRGAEQGASPSRGRPTIFAGGLVQAPPAGLFHDLAAITRQADEARGRFGAVCGLAVGPARPGPEGREILDLVFVGPAGVAHREHVLGGGPFLATVRAAKTAVDLARLTARSAAACGSNA
jgi:nicotinamide-nucleotide amidase